MEASERQQLPLDGSDAGVVRALGDRIVIESLTVNDERTARVVRERAEAGHDPAKAVADAIEVGARVLDREGTEVEVDYVRAEFERAAADSRRQLVEQSRAVVQEIERQFSAAFAEEGALTKSLGGFEDDLAEQIATHFDVERTGAVPNQIKEIVGRLVDERTQGLIRHLSSEDGANPLADFKSAVTRAVQEQVRRQDAGHREMAKRMESVHREIVVLREQADADRRVDEAEEAGTRKGRGFEARVHAGLERIAAGRGDAARHTGDESNEAGSKKGDSVVEIGAADCACLGRIVFEAKDKRLSKNDAWRELNSAMEQRDATFAVLVVAGEDRIPAGRDALHEYEGDKLIVAVDRDEPDGIPLEYAYRYARLRVLMASEQELEVDAPRVRDSAERARSQLKELQKARRSLTAINDGAENVRETIDAIDEAIRGELDRIEALVGATDA